MKNKLTPMRLITYLAGMFTLAVGLTLTAQAGLGTSPLTSIAFVLGEWLQIPFSQATLYMFIVFVVIQILLEKKKTVFRVFWLLLQIPLSIVFTDVMGLVQKIVVLSGAGVPLRVLVLLLGIVCTGIGAASTLRADLVPNPGDGVVKALATWAQKPLGRTKNVFDIANVAIAAILSFAFLGRLTGVGIGSVAAMLGVGRVIALFNRVVKPKNA